MLVELLKGDQIRNLPTNNSKAKFMWTFSKEKRNKTPKKIITDALYNINAPQNNRSTSFGYGEKGLKTKEVVD